MILREITIPLVAFATIGVFVAACPPNPGPVSPGVDAADVGAPTQKDSAPKPVPPDASVADCQSACDAMKRVGCVVLFDCAATVCKVNADPRFHHYDLACLVKVLVPADVAACGADCKVATP
jgi:hypothetical protein